MAAVGITHLAVRALVRTDTGVGVLDTRWRVHVDAVCTLAVTSLALGTVIDASIRFRVDGTFTLYTVLVDRAVTVGITVAAAIRSRLWLTGITIVDHLTILTESLPSCLADPLTTDGIIGREVFIGLAVAV